MSEVTESLQRRCPTRPRVQRDALEALRGDKTVREIADSNDIHPTQVGAWRDRVETRAPPVLRGGAAPDKSASSPRSPSRSAPMCAV